MANKGKTRLNIVDFLLIALLLLAVIAIFLRPTVVAQIGKMTANDTVIVNFVADEVSAEVLEQMTEGDRFMSGDTSFGELTAFAEAPAEEIRLIDPDNAAESAHFQKVTVPGRYSVKGQLRLSGSDRENGFYVDDKIYVGVGTVLHLRAESYVITVQITGIS